MRKFVFLLGLLFICSPVYESPLAQTPQEEASTPPSPPPEVRVYNDRLSVKAEDAEFGALMDDIARKAGFEVKIGSDIYTKRVSTSFRNMLLERGIGRLLDLIGQKTYFIHYGPEGHISKIEVFSSAPRGTGQVEKRAPYRPPRGPAQRSAPVPPRRGMRMSVKERQPSVNESNTGVTTVPSTTVPLTPPPFEPDMGVNEMEETPEFMEPSEEEGIEPLMDEPIMEELEEEEQADEPASAPYIPPRRAPAFVPKRPN